MQRVRCFAQRMNHLARTLIRRDGNNAQHLREWLDQRVLVRALEHQKAHRPIERSNQKRRVGHRYVIGDKQRAAFDRHLLSPSHVQAV